MDNPELVKQAEIDFNQLIYLAHKSGLSYWWILRVVLKAVESLVMRADVEYFLKGGK